MHCRSPFVRILYFGFLLILVLTACSVEGGVPEVTPTALVAPLPRPTDSVAAAALAARNDTWKIGLLDKPKDLYPYQPDSNSQRIAAPVLELLFPSPILTFNYGYTTTGVLTQIPTIENGGAEVRKADVYLDSTGNITTTVTQVVTQADQLVVTYRWNPDLRWSDGQPVTAADSVFAYELAKKKPPSDEAIDRLAATLRYEQVDEHTTRAILRPDVIGATYFLNYWTPLPQHLLKDVPPDQLRSSNFARMPVGYGPYAIKDLARGEIQMVRNKYYAGRSPAASQLTISFLSNIDLLRSGILNNNLDVVMTDRIPTEQFSVLDRDAKDDLINIHYIPNPIWEHIDLNLDVPVLQDYRVRQAIAFGTDRQAMVNKLFNGHTPILEDWVLPSQAEAAPLDKLTRYAYDPEKARKLLADSGYVDKDGDGVRSGPNGLTLTLQLVTSDNAMRQAIAEQFKQNMQAIGIKINISVVPLSVLFKPDGPLYRRKFQLALFGWGASPDAGGLSLWSCNYVPSQKNGWNGENFAGWCFREADLALRKGVTTLDLKARRDAYLRQQQIWTKEIPSLPLFQRLSLALTRKEVIGPLPDAFAPITWNVQQWQRKQ